ncbi:DUF3006 domain-containing protein [Tindallia californiensis]|uniref:DUF3006 domain-containing protein n=1 Tax=Tindallia californiensis TaxID=159292 RepID=A0A1H3KGL4_9FIRM|nr:DUF3006 domain-containing protein [Tindallia californiensis]SDY51311.1 Protein of unknown function [Tindallia californiensis]
MKVIIDRLEGEYAVVELDNGDFANVPRNVLPNLVDEGDVITIEIDEEATDQRRKRLEGLMEGL